MANCCMYDMKVIGSKDACKEFQDVLNYKSDRFFDRVYEAYVWNECNIGNNYVLEIDGDCAWSVLCSMVDKTYDNRPDRTTMEEESKRLNLDIEIYSIEPSIGFAEHFRFKNGERLIDECVDYDEIYWDRGDFPTIEELNAECGTEYTEDDFDENDCHIVGGFGDWTFAA